MSVNNYIQLYEGYEGVIKDEVVILEMTSGELFLGKKTSFNGQTSCNSYCPEEVAIICSEMKGQRNTIKRIVYFVSPSESKNNGPCLKCRDMLVGFINDSVEILYINIDDKSVYGRNVISKVDFYPRPT